MNIWCLLSKWRIFLERVISVKLLLRDYNWDISHNEAQNVVHVKCSIESHPFTESANNTKIRHLLKESNENSHVSAEHKFVDQRRCTWELVSTAVKNRGNQKAVSNLSNDEDLGNHAMMSHRRHQRNQWPVRRCRLRRRKQVAECL